MLRRFASVPQHRAVDAIDRAILEHLEHDGRLSNTELADRVRLTPGPTLRRVQRLERDGVIVGYRAVLDPVAVGRAFEVLVDIDLTTQEAATVERFERAMTSHDEVFELRRLFGTPDYFARVAVADLGAYEVFLTAHVLTIPGVGRVNSRFPMKVLKSAH